MVERIDTQISITQNLEIDPPSHGQLVSVKSTRQVNEERMVFPINKLMRKNLISTLPLHHIQNYAEKGHNINVEIRPKCRKAKAKKLLEKYI